MRGEEKWRKQCWAPKRRKGRRGATSHFHSGEGTLWRFPQSFIKGKKVLLSKKGKVCGLRRIAATYEVSDLDRLLRAWLLGNVGISYSIIHLHARIEIDPWLEHAIAGAQVEMLAIVKVADVFDAAQN